MSGAMIESLEIYVHIMQKTELKLETNLCLDFPIFIGKFFRRAMVWWNKKGSTRFAICNVT